MPELLGVSPKTKQGERTRVRAKWSIVFCKWGTEASMHWWRFEYLGSETAVRSSIVAKGWLWYLIRKLPRVGALGLEYLGLLQNGL